ncbi:branched-chain amino acid transporter AzlD [Legionella israelensis]|uniref:Branched-chain amino acid transport protein (AzlD) n=1 Tax=Legionella israelensis TaxID=454 RepID=A0A0W0V1L7_9GAMM|nr:AzlD domain-containing protein [Legionella israelensis]KTD13998.1 Branched-chain amino acid transport protein (AzlD) [Legionella israelensis]QBR82955.1 branched-chain amino acid transporter AzlD [Legionella israelensis]QBS09657.1 branched-chain amino acid transporter AzlD [Legionella israelensis]QDP71528.1 branched-chain amino acid transporter AzlD [Legionella israelensis]SCY25839.1 Branched-chain amino acid transport protein AzlD [Legionella israelensis DSM 19235]
MNRYYWLVTISLSLLIIVTRSLPFLMARFMTKRLNELGKYLPAYIMLLLVIYEIDIQTIIRPPYAITAWLALSILLAIHLWLRNTLLSIFIGTLSYIIIGEFWKMTLI